MDVERKIDIILGAVFGGFILMGLFFGMLQFEVSQPVLEQNLSDSDLNVLGSMMLQAGAWTNDCGLLGKTPILIEQEPFRQIVNTISQVAACEQGPGTLKSIDQNGQTIEYCETIVSIVGCV